MGEPKIVVVDYHKGNLSSVVRGLARAGAVACTSDDPEQIRRADGLVIPGGESTVQKKLLHELGLYEPLKEKIQNGLPVFGTCAGMILLAEKIDAAKSHASARCLSL